MNTLGKRTWFAAPLGLLLLSGLGCAGTQYGARHYEVLLETVPSGCESWVIPNDVWLAERDELLDPDGDALEDFEPQFTPWTISELPYQFVFIARHEGVLRHKPFTPSRVTSVRVEFAAEPAAAAAPAAPRP